MNNRIDLTFNDQNDSLVVIMSQVALRLLSHRQLHSCDLESAGVLIGERRGPHIVVYDISEPGHGDIRSRYEVDRLGAHHQAKVYEVFNRSSGTKQYVGEWHTHPEDFPIPSDIDKRSWSKNLNSNIPMIVLIVGRSGLWVGKKEKDIIIPLTQLRD
jgi:integrative and conjugative element protein (TIGR02256 family)